MIINCSAAYMRQNQDYQSGYAIQRNNFLPNGSPQMIVVQPDNPDIYMNSNFCTPNMKRGTTTITYGRITLYTILCMAYFGMILLARFLPKYLGCLGVIFYNEESPIFLVVFHFISLSLLSWFSVPFSKIKTWGACIFHGLLRFMVFILYIILCLYVLDQLLSLFVFPFMTLNNKTKEYLSDIRIYLSYVRFSYQALLLNQKYNTV